MAGDRMPEANGGHINNLSIGSQANKYEDSMWFLFIHLLLLLQIMFTIMLKLNEILKSRSLHFSEALQMQIEVQRRLHEQLEVQNN